jgi:hypothetical protein
MGTLSLCPPYETRTLVVIARSAATKQSIFLGTAVWIASLTLAMTSGCSRLTNLVLRLGLEIAGVMALMQLA